MWHRTSAATWPAIGSICCNVERTNTAVFPIPDLAWQMTSIPRIAWGMHSCWTDEEPKKFDPRKPQFQLKNFYHSTSPRYSDNNDLPEKHIVPDNCKSLLYDKFISIEYDISVDKKNRKKDRAAQH